MQARHSTSARFARAAAAAALGLTMVLGTAGAALADGGSASNPDAGLTPLPSLPLPQWKLDLVALHKERVAGTMTQADADRYAKIVADQGLGGGATASATGGVSPMVASYSSHSLTVTQRPQLQNNWPGRGPRLYACLETRGCAQSSALFPTAEGAVRPLMSRLTKRKRLRAMGTRQTLHIVSRSNCLGLDGESPVPHGRQR